jgi:2'-5' RNA ligase
VSDAKRRVFAGLVPPEELARELARRAAEALPAAQVRLSPALHLHLTLCFVGDVPEALLAERKGALDAALARAAAAAAPLALCVEGSGAFPDARRARVLWAGVVDDPRAGRPGALAALQRDLARELAAAGLAPLDGGRPFRPHLTLARPRAQGGVALPAAFRELALDLCWTARELAWIESCHDGPAAERYPVLARHALGGTR